VYAPIAASLISISSQPEILPGRVWRELIRQ
jgi:hypothetical protein